MHHSQSYPVTMIQVNLPQPHIDNSTRTTHLGSIWCAFVLVGVFSVAFILGVYFFGANKLYPVTVKPHTDLVLIIKQGYLQVHPFLDRTDIGIESHYSTHLPPRNLTQTVTSMDVLFQAYPAKHEDPYRNCWLENSGPKNPCYFDASWIAEVCTSNDSYGYEEDDGHFSPCFVMRLEQTGDWTPRSTDDVPKGIADHYDPGFSPVLCYAKGDKRQDPSPNITLYPPKGFSHLFFPASRFDPGSYLLPMVAVRVHRIPKGKNFTIECSVVTPNAFFLWDNGKAVIRFEAA